MSAKRNHILEGHMYNGRSRRKHVESPNCWCKPDAMKMSKLKTIYIHPHSGKDPVGVVINRTTGERSVL